MVSLAFTFHMFVFGGQCTCRVCVLLLLTASVMLGQLQPSYSNLVTVAREKYTYPTADVLVSCCLLWTRWHVFLERKFHNEFVWLRHCQPPVPTPFCRNHETKYIAAIHSNIWSLQVVKLRMDIVNVSYTSKKNQMILEDEFQGGGFIVSAVFGVVGFALLVYHVGDGFKAVLEYFRG